MYFLLDMGILSGYSIAMLVYQRVFNDENEMILNDLDI